MSGYYVYLLSSLPMLRFAEPPPFSYDVFLERCKGLVSDEDMAVLGSIRRECLYAYRGPQATLKKISAFETALRNDLVRIRAARRHVDPAGYVREGEESMIATNHVAVNAHRSTSILESERILDRARWHALDELEMGHYFDADALIVYACRLLIAEKWHKIESADKTAVLETALNAG